MSDKDESEEAIEAIVRAVMICEHVYIAGNGGSAANALHLSNDLVSVGVRAHAMTGDIATLTALANDFAYSEIFSRQLDVMLTERDLLICLSGSGRSVNILRAIETAIAKGAGVCCVFGAFNEHEPFGKSSMILSMGNDMQDAEERQILLGHEIMRRIKAARELH